jgi:hypothetical protein
MISDSSRPFFSQFVEMRMKRFERIFGRMVKCDPGSSLVMAL